MKNNELLKDAWKFWKSRCESTGSSVWTEMNLYSYFLSVISKMGDEDRLACYDLLAELNEHDLEIGNFD